MSILKYRAFLTTVQCKSMTKAADILGYTQPYISYLISSLEGELGFPLLTRTKDGVVPTENAKYLQTYMQQIVFGENSFLEVASKINGIEIGTLRIGSFFSPSTLWFPKIISSFLQKHPSIELQIFEGSFNEISDWLEDGTIGLAVTSPLNLDNFDFMPLYDDPILAVVSKNNPLANQKVIDINDLIKYPFIAPLKGADESINGVMQAEGLTPNIRFRIKGDMSSLAMIGEDLGVSLIPKLAVIPGNSDIVARPLLRPHYRTLGICARDIQRSSLLSHAFIEETQDFLRSQNMLGKGIPH